jgi:hypothetical protein
MPARFVCNQMLCSCASFTTRCRETGLLLCSLQNEQHKYNSCSTSPKISHQARLCNFSGIPASLNLPDSRPNCSIWCRTPPSPKTGVFEDGVKQTSKTPCLCAAPKFHSITTSQPSNVSTGLIHPAGMTSHLPQSRQVGHLPASVQLLTRPGDETNKHSHAERSVQNLLSSAPVGAACPSSTNSAKRHERRGVAIRPLSGASTPGSLKRIRFSASQIPARLGSLADWPRSSGDSSKLCQSVGINALTALSTSAGGAEESPIARCPCHALSLQSPIRLQTRTPAAECTALTPPMLQQEAEAGERRSIRITGYALETWSACPRLWPVSHVSAAANSASCFGSDKRICTMDETNKQPSRKAPCSKLVEGSLDAGLVCMPVVRGLAPDITGPTMRASLDSPQEEQVRCTP